MAERTFVCASSQELQKPMEDAQVAQIVVEITGNWTLVSQLRTEREPRKESTMSLLVVSVATKPVMSDLTELVGISKCQFDMLGMPYFWNSISVFVLAASTRAQLPCGHIIFVPGLLLFTRQYAAAEYWLKNWS